MLSRYDDYPIHQTPEPIAHTASSDRNVYDRYWFNGYAEDGEFYFAIGLALYPEHASTLTGLLREADQAMYRAKARTRGAEDVGSAELLEKAM